MAARTRQREILPLLLLRPLAKPCTARDTGGMSSTARKALHQIVVNDAREFAVWPSARPLPPGWRPAGRTGTREELMTHLRSAFAPLVDLPPARK